MKKAYEYFSNKHLIMRQQLQQNNSATPSSNNINSQPNSKRQIQNNLYPGNNLSQANKNQIDEQPSSRFKRGDLMQEINQSNNNDNSSVSLASHNILPSERRHHASSIEPQIKMRDQNKTKKLMKDHSLSSSVQNSATNSLKNSKNSEQHSKNINNSYITNPNIRAQLKYQEGPQLMLQQNQLDQIYQLPNSQVQFMKQNSLNSQQESQGLQIPHSAETIKMSKVKSYGNLSSKQNKQRSNLTNDFNQKYQNPIQSTNQFVINKQNINNYFKINPQQAELLKNEHQFSRDEATQLLLQYSSNYQKALSSDISGLSIGTDNLPTKRESSPRFLQINLKMFNNYMTSSNSVLPPPQNENFQGQINIVPNANKYQTIDGKFYDVDRSNSQAQKQKSNSFYNNNDENSQISNDRNLKKNLSKEKIRIARDQISKVISDDNTLNLISQVSKKSIELQQQIERNKGNISVDMISQINKQGGFVKNLHQLKAFNMLSNQYQDDQQQHSTSTLQNNNTNSQSTIITQTQMNSVHQTIQQSSIDKKRPQSELIAAPLYQQCQQSIQNQNLNQRASKSKLTPLTVEKPQNGFSNLTSILNSKTNINQNQNIQSSQKQQLANQRLASYSSCSLLQAGANNLQINQNNNSQNQSQANLIDNSNIIDEISPNQKKNHVGVLVTLLDEKNKYIKQLLKQIEKLNSHIKKHQIDFPTTQQTEIETYRKSNGGSKSKLKALKHQSPTHKKSRSQFNMQRAKSASLISNIQKSKQMHHKKEEFDAIYNSDIQVENSGNLNRINSQFDKLIENMNQFKIQNVHLMKELLLNEDSSFEGTLTEEGLRNNDFSRQNSQFQSNIVEDCNYLSVGGNINVSQDESSYQDYLNNADLEANEEMNLRKEKSNEKKKIIKSSSNIKTKKSNQPSKCPSVRGGSSKNTARGNGSQSQLVTHNNQQQIVGPPHQQQQKSKQNPNAASFKSNIPSYRPPTSSAIGSQNQTGKTKKLPASSIINGVKIKKPSISSALENYSKNPSAYLNPPHSAFQSIASIKDTISTHYIQSQQKHQAQIQMSSVAGSHQKATIYTESNNSKQNQTQSQLPNMNQLQILKQQQQQHQILVDQLNQCKVTLKQKDKKIEKHKDFINQLKGSLEQVLSEHKKQAEQLENQKKELRALKCKLSIQ